MMTWVRGRLNPAELAFLKEALRRPGFGRMAQVLGDHQRHPGFVGSVDHRPALV